MVTEKTCSKCKELKPSQAYYKDKKLKSGLYSQCKTCCLIEKKKYYEVNQELIKAKERQRWKDHGAEIYLREKESGRLRRRRQRYNERHRDKVLAKMTEWREANREYFKKYREVHKETINSRVKNWAADNKDKRAASSAHRRAAKLQRTPNWLSQDHIDLMKEIYKSCPKSYHVDHIIPLQGDTVSGLHVPWNLQHLTEIENLSKGNKLPSDK